MKQIPIQIHPEQFPASFRVLLEGADLYDSSCSPEARVYFIDKQDGFYLKTGEKGALAKEAALTKYFHSKGLATEVLAYEQGERDWMLTRRVTGEDCTHVAYLSDPRRLSETTGTLLRQLHETAGAGCPVPDHTAEYRAAAERNYRAGRFDHALFPPDWGYHSAEEAWYMVETYGGELKNDTLLHGDYCLPNIMLNDWRFSGFIDLDNAGMGDRHIDLFWGIWTLQFNLKTDAYTQRFMDAYGRDKIEPELLRTVAAFEVFG